MQDDLSEQLREWQSNPPKDDENQITIPAEKRIHHSEQQAHSLPPKEQENVTEDYREWGSNPPQPNDIR